MTAAQRERAFDPSSAAETFGTVMFEEILIPVFLRVTGHQEVNSFLNLGVLKPAQPALAAPRALRASPELFYFGNFNFVH